MNACERMKALNIVLPPVPCKGGVYAPAKRTTDGLVYVSGCGPSMGEPVKGKLGREFKVEDGQAHARQCMLNALAILQAEIGDLEKVRRVVKILVLVAGSDDFYDQPAVANGASQLLVDLFGEERGLPARSAIGVNALPGNMPVEIEAIFELL